MPTNNLSKRQANYISILFTAILILVTILSAYQTVQISQQNTMIHRQQRMMTDLPKEYVRLERYRCDQERIEKTLGSIDSKVTILLGQNTGPPGP